MILLSNSYFYNININTISFIFRVKMSSSRTRKRFRLGWTTYCLCSQFFTCTQIWESQLYHMQTSSTATVKAICCSPDKAKLLKSAMETKSPIMLRKYQFSEHFNNIVVNKNTVIQNYTKSLDFKPSETLQTQLMTIRTLSTQSPLNNWYLLKPRWLKVTYWTKNPVHRARKLPFRSPQQFWWIPHDTSVLNLGRNGSTITYIFKNLRVKDDNYTKEKYVNHDCKGRVWCQRIAPIYRHLARRTTIITGFGNENYHCLCHIL